MKFELSRYKLGRYFWSLFGVLGIVMFWAGVWDGLGNLPYLGNPLISLFTGLFILLISGLIIKELGSGEESNGKLVSSLHKVHNHPEKHHFDLKYFDKIKKNHQVINAGKLQKIEKNMFLVFKHERKEFFVPVRRVKEILHKGKKWNGK